MEHIERKGNAMNISSIGFRGFEIRNPEKNIENEALGDESKKDIAARRKAAETEAMKHHPFAEGNLDGDVFEQRETREEALERHLDRLPRRNHY